MKGKMESVKSILIACLLILLISISTIKATEIAKNDDTEIYTNPKNRKHKKQREEYNTNPVTKSLKREFRGAWFPTVVNDYWRYMSSEQIKDDICNILDKMASVNINAVIFQVRPQADALFVSNLEPWSRFITGEQGREPVPFFDPAAFVIEECHKRGMEFHAWFNPYRVTSNEKETLAKDHLYYKNPNIFVKYGKQTYFNPGEPESRAHTLKVIADFIKWYDTDAVHFDDYFYPYRVDNIEFPDDATFIKYGKDDGFAPPHNGKRYGVNDSAWIDAKDEWRRHNVTTLIKALHNTIKSEKPWVKFGISPFGIWREQRKDPRGSFHPTKVCSNYDDLFADILLWSKEGWIDYCVPQLYWPIGHKSADYKGLAEWWSRNKGISQLYVGQSISATLNANLPDGTTADQLYQKMKIDRELGNYDGNIWWSGLQLVKDDRMLDSLKNSYQRFPALHPLYPKIDSIPPEPLKKFKVTIISNKNRSSYDEIVLKWDAPEYTDVMNEAKWYAVYLFDKGEDIDIDNSAKLIKITNSSEVDIRNVQSGQTVAVTAIDRMWNESEALLFHIPRKKR